MRKALETLIITIIVITFVFIPTDARAEEETRIENSQNTISSSIAAEETSTLKETASDQNTVDDAAQITPQITYGEIIIAAFIAFLSGICCVLIFVFTVR